MMIRQHRKRNIMPHGNRRFYTRFRHWQNLILDILICVSKYLIQLISHFLRVYRDLSIRDRKVIQMQKASVKPFSIRLCMCIGCLAVLIGNDLVLFGIYQKDPARLKPCFFDNVILRDIQNTNLRCEDQPVVIRNIVT